MLFNKITQAQRNPLIVEELLNVAVITYIASRGRESKGQKWLTVQ